MSQREVVRGKLVDDLIIVIRGQRVMLDASLARLYGVEVKALNRAVRRNRARFPEDFVFRLSQEEWVQLRCQAGTSKGRGGRRYRPYAFTEHGAVMLASVLNSARAIRVSIFVTRPSSGYDAYWVLRLSFRPSWMSSNAGWSTTMARSKAFSLPYAR